MRIQYHVFIVAYFFSIHAAQPAPIGEYPHYPVAGAKTTVYEDGRQHTYYPTPQAGGPPPYSSQSSVVVTGSNNLVVQTPPVNTGAQAILQSAMPQKILVGLCISGVLYFIYRHRAQAIGRKLINRYTISDIDITLDELKKMDTDQLVGELLDSFANTHLTSDQERMDEAPEFLEAAELELLLLERYIIFAERDAHYHLGPLAVTSLDLYENFLDRSDRLHYCMQVMEKWLRTRE